MQARLLAGVKEGFMKKTPHLPMEGEYRMLNEIFDWGCR
jgi:hypothetical protein